MSRDSRLFRWAFTFFAAVGMLMAQGTANPPAAGKGQGSGNRLARIATILGLSADQQSQIQTILQNAMTQAKPVMTQLSTNRQAIKQLIESGNTANLDQQLQPLANTQGSLTTQLTMIHAQAAAQVWNLLTPDQRTKADQLHELFGGMAFGGMGGPGMGPQRFRGAPPSQQ